jgi:ATP-dependent DNA ligase
MTTSPKRRKRTGIMLAYPFNVNRLHKWPKPWLVQPKINGERCRVELSPPGTVLLNSSTGLRFESVPHIVESLRLSHIPPDLHLDGELYCHGMKLQDIHSIVSRHTVTLHPDHLKIRYYIFDLIQDVPQYERIRTLKDLFRRKSLPFIELVPTIEVNTTTHLLTCFDYFVDEGYEGIIIRHPHKPYIPAKTVYMMKHKKRQRLTATIVGYEEEHDKHGQPKGTLGAVVAKLSPLVTVSVGSGFTADERIDYWLDRDKLLGQLVLIEYQEPTSKGSLVNPTFKGLLTEPQKGVLNV